MFILIDLYSFPSNHVLTVTLSTFVGLVVPDVPLEETEYLRKEALKHNLELVSLLSLIILFLLFSEA